MSQTIFTGVCTALVTPFIEGCVNYPMAEQLLQRQIESGINAVVVAGTTGEAPTLTDEEKIELFRRCKLHAGNRCKIIAGTGSNSTAHAVVLSKAAESVGVDALLVVSPYYNKGNDDGIFLHYLSIANTVRIPIIIYNVPSRTGLDIPVSVYRKLATVPNIIGVKEASTDITKITKIKSLCPETFAVWTGNDEHTVPAIALGARGVISVTANICPGEMLTMTEAALAGDMDTAADCQCKLQTLNELLFCDVNPIPVKTAMKLIGYDCGPCRLPLTDLHTEKYERIRMFFQ